MLRSKADADPRLKDADTSLGVGDILASKAFAATLKEQLNALRELYSYLNN